MLYLSASSFTFSSYLRNSFFTPLLLWRCEVLCTWDSREGNTVKYRICSGAALQKEASSRTREVRARDRFCVCHNMTAREKRKREKPKETRVATQMEVWLSHWQSLASHFHTLWNLIKILSRFYRQTLLRKLNLPSSERVFTECAVLILHFKPSLMNAG